MRDTRHQREGPKCAKPYKPSGDGKSTSPRPAHVMKHGTGPTRRRTSRLPCRPRSPDDRERTITRSPARLAAGRGRCLSAAPPVLHRVAFTASSIIAAASFVERCRDFICSLRRSPEPFSGSPPGAPVLQQEPPTCLCSAATGSDSGKRALTEPRNNWMGVRIILCQRCCTSANRPCITSLVL